MQPPTEPPDVNGAITRVLVAVAVLVSVGFCAWRIVSLNDGPFTFTLDDAYIHLRLAREIAAGHYGYNAGEPASPASSILYPFLLAPFVAIGVGTSGALFLNVAPLVLAAVQLHDWLHGELRASAAMSALLTLLILFVFNIVGLALAGMETVLQVWLCVLICRGLWRIVATGRAPGAGFWCAIVIGPAVRYEMLALTLAGVVVYAWKAGHLRLALAALAAALAPVVGFSIFLVGHGLEALPDAVLIKAPYLDPLRTPGALASFITNLIANGPTVPGTVLSAVALIAAAGTLHRRERLPFGALALFVVVAQLGIGEVGWWGRYEAWSLVTLACLAAAAWAPFDEWRERVPLPAIGIAIACALLATHSYIRYLGETPLGAHNVYAQQAQLARIASRLGVRSVAANDVGAIGWMNPDVYVFDVTGLASHDVARQRRCCRLTERWVEDAAARHGVELVLAYDEALPGSPSSWTKVGDLMLEGEAVKVGGTDVSIYATPRSSASTIRLALRRLAHEMPADARLVAPSARESSPQ